MAPSTRRSLVVAIVLVFSAAAATSLLPRRHMAVSPLDGANAQFHVGLVFDVGGRGDKSFNDAAYSGLLAAQRTFGITIEALEPAGNDDREAALRLFAARRFELVVAVGFIFSSDVDRVARDFPTTIIACIDYAPSSGGMLPNVAGLAFREEEGSFLVGAVAGLMTRTAQVGFVGGMEMPLVHKFEAGYAAGVHAVCSRCVVHSAYAGTGPDAFKDPAKGKALAIAEIAAGVDVLYHAAGATGHGVIEAARDSRRLAIGVDRDQHDEMPGTVLTSMIKRADVVVLETVRTVVDGRFRGGMRVLGVKEGAIDYVHDGPHASLLPTDVISRVESLRDDIVMGRIHVPSE